MERADGATAIFHTKQKPGSICQSGAEQGNNNCSNLFHCIQIAKLDPACQARAFLTQLFGNKMMEKELSWYGLPGVYPPPPAVMQEQLCGPPRTASPQWIFVVSTKIGLMG